MIERAGLRALDLLEVRDEHDAVPDGDAEDRDESDDRAERQPAAGGDEHGGEPADEGERHVHHREGGESCGAEVEHEEDEDAEQRERAEAEEALAGGGGGRVLAADLGVDTRGERGFRDRPADVARDGVERPPAGVEADEDGAHAVLVHDRRAERRDVDVGDGAERHDAPFRRHQQ